MKYKTFAELTDKALLISPQESWWRDVPAVHWEDVIYSLRNGELTVEVSRAYAVGDCERPNFWNIAECKYPEARFDCWGCCHAAYEYRTETVPDALALQVMAAALKLGLPIYNKEELQCSKLA
jgi:hypothetical protein